MTREQAWQKLVDLDPNHLIGFRVKDLESGLKLIMRGANPKQVFEGLDLIRQGLFKISCGREKLMLAGLDADTK